MTTTISDGTLRLCQHVLTLQLQMLNTLGYPALAMRDAVEEIDAAIFGLPLETLKEMRIAVEEKIKRDELSPPSASEPLGIAKIIAKGGKDVKEWK